VLYVMMFAPALCIGLQGFSRNLIYIFLAVASLMAVIAVLIYETKGTRWFVFPSLLTNGFLLFRCIQLHRLYADAISDYLISSVLLVVFMLMTIIAIIPIPKSDPSE